MPIRTTCPGCRKTYSLNESFRGKMVRCKTCQKTFTVGDSEEEILDAVAAEDDEPIEAVLVEPAGRRVASQPPRPRAVDREEDEYAENLRPRRRRPQQQSSNTGVLIGVAIGGGVMLIVGAIVVVWLLLSGRNSNSPVVQSVPPINLGAPPPDAGRNNPNPAPVNPPNPPPADQGGMPPADPNPQPGGKAPARPDAPAGETVVTLSNPRRSNEIGLRSGFSVDYRFNGGAPRFGGVHYRIVVKQAGGGISHGDIHGLLDQEGTLNFREFGGFGPGMRGAAEIYMERSNVPGPFGQWTKCSNSVTLN